MLARERQARAAKGLQGGVFVPWKGPDLWVSLARKSTLRGPMRAQGERTEGSMSRIPVLGTVSRAYGFLLGEFGTILRLAWAPLLVGAAVSYFYGGAAIDAAIDAHANPSAAAAYEPVQLLIGIVAFLTGIIAEVALLRVVIFGDRMPGLFVYLWLGGGEFRLIIVTILLGIAIIAGAIAAGLVFGILAALSTAIPVIGVAVAFGLIVLVCVAIWAGLRLTLVAPVVVGEHSLGVERSWAITHGNALHMLGVLLLTFAPLFILSIVAFFAVLGGAAPALPHFPDLTPGAGADAAASSKAAAEAFAKDIERWQFDLLRAMRGHWLTFSVLNFFGNLISTALWAGALGNAYVALVGERKS